MKCRNFLCWYRGVKNITCYNYDIDPQECETRKRYNRIVNSGTEKYFKKVFNKERKKAREENK